MADLYYSKILIRAHFFQPLPLATKYVVALNTLKSNHSLFDHEDMQEQSFRFPVYS